VKRARPLQLNHFDQGRRAARAGWALLLAALLVVSALAAHQHVLGRELDALESQASRAQRSPAGRAPVSALDPRRLDDAARRASTIALELRLPWSELFDAVEAAADPAVALLSVEPDVRRAALRISGEARNKPAMLKYVGRLGAQRPIVRAMLESHAERVQGAGGPVQFTLVAYWENRP